MKINYSNILKIIISIILIIVFTIGFNQGQEIDDLAYAIAIGIDVSKSNNLKVSFQFAKPINASEGGGTSDSQPSFIHTVEASSITSAINLLNSFMSKRLNLSHCKVIVFSEEFAKKGISQEELGDAVFVTGKHLSYIETGTKAPSLELLILLANALDATADDLLADHLTGSNTTLKEEVIDLLHDSTPAEKAILMDMLRHMKTLLQEHGI